MKIYVTGATGFVGSHVVDAAVRRGHEVVAVVRPSSSASAGSPESADSVSTANVDLRSQRGLAASMAGVDMVVHLAAAKSGDFYTQFAGTVLATENLLAAMAESGVNDLVGISTFSVYDYLNTKAGTVIDEASPIDASPALRDEYTRTKLLQERLYQEFGERSDHRLVILRPGMIYGADNLWHSLLGAELGPRYLKVGARATLPMSYVENCAEAIVLAAERLAEPDSPVDGEVINIVDDDLPNQREYAESVSARMETPPCISVPWPALRAAAAVLTKANNVAVGGRAKFPGIAVPERLDARFKPFRFTNTKAKALLDWTPRYDLATALDRSIEVQNATERSG